VPNSASAEKRVRQSASRNARNLWRKRRVKDQVKAFLTAVQAHDVNKAEDEFRKTCSVLDKIADTKTIHKNTAARRKSRLNNRLRALKAAGAKR
jgi:small subunit ribosomal protein S20